MNRNVEIDLLVERCKDKDARAQMQLYDRYCDAMFQTAYNFMRDEFLAQDVMQEAFIKAFKKIDLYNAEATFGTWLKKIVVNTALDWLKARKVETVNVDSFKISVEEESDWELESRATYEKVLEFIEKLPDKYRNVLKLYLLEGYDHSEVSQILQISEVSSRSQLARGKNKLIQMLNQNN